MKLRILWVAPIVGAHLIAGPTQDTDLRGISAPPPAPPIEHRPAVVPERWLHSSAVTYSIGDPTPEEQLYIEMINRARANPVAEAQTFATTTDAEVIANYDFYQVDLGLMQQQFAVIPPAPPVAPNAQLAEAARRHSADMLQNSFQEHVGSDGSNPGQRVQAAGYPIRLVGENVYANGRSVFHGHTAFEVDWGPGPGGMQTPPGHRNSIHSPDFREIGLSVLFGENTPAPGSQIPGSREVGPQVVTQEFGQRQNATPFITGVIYFDLNGNNFYDSGEGIGGVHVAASGTTTTGVSARSGGYALPISGNGTYTVTFTGEGMSAVSQQITVAQNQNVKVDLRPAYAAPTLTGSAEPFLNRSNFYQISPVPLATAYQGRTFQLVAPSIEGAENGSANVTIEKFGNYEVFENQAKKSGAYSFHLLHPQGGIRNQTLRLNGNYVIGANSVLRFSSRLGIATEFQIATVQVSTNNGVSWIEVYSQAGADVPGERTFQERSISLAQFAGAALQVRFVFVYVPGELAYIDVNPDTGWLIDDIRMDNTSLVANEQIIEAPNGIFAFRPATLGTFVLEGRALAGGHEFLPWGPGLTVASRDGGPELRFSGVRTSNGQLEFDVQLASGNAPNSMTLETASTVGGGWTAVATTVQNISATQFLLKAPLGVGSMAFYRIKVN